MNVTWGTLLKHAGIAAVVAIAVNAAVSVAARALLDIPAEFEPVTAQAAVIATSMYMVMGIVALVLVARFAKKRPARAYWILATVALLVSFIPNVQLVQDPSEFPGYTQQGLIVLIAQHVVAYLIFVPWVTRVLSKAR